MPFVTIAKFEALPTANTLAAVVLVQEAPGRGFRVCRLDGANLLGTYPRQPFAEFANIVDAMRRATEEVLHVMEDEG